MSIKRVGRRTFLKSASVAVAAVAGSGVIVAPNGAWALTLTKLDAATGKALIRMTRDLYPHDQFDDAYYAKVVEALDQSAAKDDALAKLLTDGVAALDKANDGSYLKATDARRLATLVGMQTDPFFQKVRGTVVTTLYNDPKVWEKLGYEGASAEQGGYLSRGFDDIDWLPKQG
jgi:hypothetical protein